MYTQSYPYRRVRSPTLWRTASLETRKVNFEGSFQDFSKLRRPKYGWKILRFPQQNVDPVSTLMVPRLTSKVGDLNHRIDLSVKFLRENADRFDHQEQ